MSHTPADLTSAIEKLDTLDLSDGEVEALATALAAGREVEGFAMKGGGGTYDRLSLNFEEIKVTLKAGPGAPQLLDKSSPKLVGDDAGIV